MQVTYNVLTPNIKHPYKLICLSESMLHLVLKGLSYSVFWHNYFYYNYSWLNKGLLEYDNIKIAFETLDEPTIPPGMQYCHSCPRNGNGDIVMEHYNYMQDAPSWYGLDCVPPVATTGHHWPPPVVLKLNPVNMTLCVHVFIDSLFLYNYISPSDHSNLSYR